MNLLQRLKELHVRLPFVLGDELGSGIDGQVFENKSDNNNVIKISCVAANEYWDSVHHLLFQLKDKKYWHFAKVYEFGPLLTFDQGDDDLDLPSKEFTIHYVEMEKLLHLSEDERKLFHTLLSHEDANKKKEYTRTQLISLIEELSKWLSFDKESALAFCYAVMNCPIHHKDLHTRNIMKNAAGGFRLVDFDRLSQ